MTVDMPALVQRGAAARLKQIAIEVADLRAFLAAPHTANGAAPAPAPRRPVGEIETELEAHAPRPRTTRPVQTVAARAATRRATAAFLTAFSKPVTLTDLRRAGILLPARATIGALVRYGYLRRRGDTFHKTRRVFLE